MELGDIVNTIVDYVPSINWHITNDQVSVFETTIRYLGGLLAGKQNLHTFCAGVSVTSGLQHRS